MPTSQDPISAADTASESMRALAHATRSMDNPSQTYDVLGNLIAAVRSLGQVLDQVASAHLVHRARAFTDAGDSGAGAAHADNVTAALRDAALHLSSIENDLDAASQHSGRIAWHPMAAPKNPDRAGGREHLAMKLESELRFGTSHPEAPRRGFSL